MSDTKCNAMVQCNVILQCIWCNGAMQCDTSIYIFEFLTFQFALCYILVSCRGTRVICFNRPKFVLLNVKYLFQTAV